MKRENRINLWFLAAFVVLALPGVVILMRRKFTTSTSPALLYPDSMSHRLAYVVPLPAPPDATWFSPPLTQSWLADLVRQRAGDDSILHDTDERGDPVPLISADHRVEILQLTRAPHVVTFAGLIWTDVADPSAKQAISVSGVPSDQIDCRVVDAIVIPVPQPVRQELMNFGYPRPPKNVIWFRAEGRMSSPSTAKNPVINVATGAVDGKLSTVTLPTPGNGGGL